MSEVVRRIHPTQTDEYLANPHKGCCTFQHFNGDELFPGVCPSEEGPLEFPGLESEYKTQAAVRSANPGGRREKVVRGYLPTTVAYCRWFWRMMEPEQGRYDFSMVDKTLEMCRRRGQTLAVRLMAFGAAGQPQVPEWYAGRHPMETRRTKSAEQRTPNHDTPEYLESWGGFVKEFAGRYDGNQLLESLDVAFVGPWGEGAGECSVEQCDRFAELWQKAFPSTPRLALIAGQQLQSSISRGSGWRCDCFGGLQTSNNPHVRHDVARSHMYDCYPKALCQSEATRAWETAPVHLETCWVPMNWYQWNWDIDFILEQGLKYHGTYFMPKYTALPEPWMDKLELFCRKLGYRYIFRLAVIDRKTVNRGMLNFEAWIENTGVAPIYRKYAFALRLRQDEHEAVILQDDIDIRTWLPGDIWLDRQVQIPEGFRAGWVELSAGLVSPETKKVHVKFAAKERYSDDWLDLYGFEIV